MKKTQVQIPDELFYQAKRTGKEMEVSFADLVRRGLEYIVRVHRYSGKRAGARWSPPEIDTKRFGDYSDEIDLREVLEGEIL